MLLHYLVKCTQHIVYVKQLTFCANHQTLFRWICGIQTAQIWSSEPCSWLRDLGYHTTSRLLHKTRCWQLTCKFPTWWSPFYFVQIQSQHFLKGSLDPDPALLRTIIAHPLALVLATLQLFAKLEVSNFIQSKYMQAVPKFKNSAPGPCLLYTSPSPRD